MIVHRSNRTEKLVAVLAEIVLRRPADPLARECIVVQGKGMERWLSMELARRCGVWANPDFPFPRHFIDRALKAVLGEEADTGTAFEPESLMWSVAELLPQLLHRPEFEPIRNYLSDDPRGLKRIQLAERIADTFDHYVVYRPEMVLTWETSKGREEDWQETLWRELVSRHGSTHLAARAQKFFRAIQEGASLDHSFPRRVSLFGISTLPPLYVRIFEALSRRVKTYLFVLSPSSEYWAEIRSKREIIRELSRRHADAATAQEELHLEEGHPLLASLGRVGRDFQHLLEEITQYDDEDRVLYEDPGEDSVLHRLQSDILNLRQPGRPPSVPVSARKEVSEPRPATRDDAGMHSGAECSSAGGTGAAYLGDGSISIHSCHSPMREVEVLRDQLLALFDADSTLEPREVVVMTPDIDLYAPLIDAVFGEGGTTGARIPYCIADRGARATNEVADAFLRALDLLGSHFSAPEVLDFLGLAAVRERFGIAAEEMDTVRRWITAAGIRWGIDADHRAKFDQPPALQNTWRFGLDRLFLGFAMPGNERELFAHVLPYDDVEGTTADLLGRLADFCSILFRLHATLEQPRSPAAWAKDLGQMIDDLIVNTPGNVRARQDLRDALAAVAEEARTAGFSGTVDRNAIQALVAGRLQRARSARGFLSGGVTFCELVPMRSIPFRVVCLLGMNDDAFPRTQRPPGFDRIAQRPMMGDRSQREDDRYLFLEALLSARERLLITYVGQSIRDNTEKPPSVVVTELLDAIEESVSYATLSPQDANRCQPLPAGASLGEASFPPLVLRHPLQAFSPRYFRADDPRLFSYSTTSLEGARGLLAARRPAERFVSAPIPLDSGEPRTATLEEIVRFFQNPSREFLRRRIDLSLEPDEEPLEDREPAVLSGRERWAVGETLLSRTLKGEDPQAAFAATRAGGRLPLGALGKCLYEELVGEIAALKACAEALQEGSPLNAVEFDEEIEGTRVTGVIRGLWKIGQVRCRYARIRAPAELEMWIRHLALNCFAPPDFPKRTLVIGRPPSGKGVATTDFRPLEDPRTVLAELLHLYWLGHERPLPFFPASSYAYARTLAKAEGADGREKALKAARDSFEPDRESKRSGELDDPNVAQIYAAANPLDEAARLVAEGQEEMADFERIALAVFRPLLAHREEII